MSGALQADRASRSEAWRHELSAAFSGLEVTSAGDCRGSIRSAHLGVVDVFEVAGNTQLLTRTARAARQSPLELLKVCVQVSGEALVKQGRHSVALRPGQLAVYDTSRPYTLELRGSWKCAVMTVARDTLRLPEPVLSRAMDQPHPADDGAGSVLNSYLRHSVSCDGASARVGEAGVALLAGALADGSTTSGEVGNDQLRAAVLDYLRAHLHDAALGPAAVAAAHHMAPRTLHRLFEGTELSVAAAIRDLRLEGIRNDLADPLLTGVSIGRIAARWCISDQPWLSRVFKTKFGVSPSAYRAPCVSETYATDSRRSDIQT